MKDFFPESLGQQCGYALYMAKYGTYCLQFLTGLNLLPTAALRSPGDLDCNPGLCPDWESNRWSFGSQVCTQSSEPHQPGLILIF